MKFKGNSQNPFMQSHIRAVDRKNNDGIFLKEITDFAVSDYDLCMMYGRCMGLTVWQSKFVWMIYWWTKYEEPMTDYVYLTQSFYDCVVKKNLDFTYNYSQFNKAKTFFMEQGWLSAGEVRGKYWINYDMFLMTDKVHLIYELRTQDKGE